MFKAQDSIPSTPLTSGKKRKMVWRKKEKIGRDKISLS
jgi:hypothetical protein